MDDLATEADVDLVPVWENQPPGLSEGQECRWPTRTHHPSGHKEGMEAVRRQLVLLKADGCRSCATIE
jgi:hypothetical protein